jgi:hypothetical protein
VDGGAALGRGTETPGGAARQNHHWELLENGNRLILVAIPRDVPGIGPHIVGDQGIYEVTPDGRIVWEWKRAIISTNSVSLLRDSSTCAEASRANPTTSGATCHPKVVTVHEIGVQPPAQPHVELLGPIHVGNRQNHNLKSHFHG